MECQSCGSANRAGANYCASCGSKLEKLCSNCGNQASATARFCDNCGFQLGDIKEKKSPAKDESPSLGFDQPGLASSGLASSGVGPSGLGSTGVGPSELDSGMSLDESDSSGVGPSAGGPSAGHQTELDSARSLSRPLTDSPVAKSTVQMTGGKLDPADTLEFPQPETNSGASQDFSNDKIDSAAERRQLTVVFCDLVGSTKMSEQVDAEDMRHILASYQEAVRSIVDRYAGMVARYIGDGILIYFGYPVAYEDSAERALRAALEIAAAVPRLTSKSILPNIEIQVRIGINTGRVVIGDIGSGGTREHMAAVGDVPNIAARIQSCANPGEIVVGKSTRTIVAERFVFDAMGSRNLKGISRPVELFRLLRATDEHSKIEASIRKFSGTVIGRDAELALFNNRMARVLDGDGQALLISGEAGIGKSHVVQRFRETQADVSHHEVAIYSSAQHRSSVFYPIITMLERQFGFESNDDCSARIFKLKSHLDECYQSDQLPVYSWLLGLELGASDSSLELAPDQMKFRVLTALTEYFKRLSARIPLVLIVEDVHWSDPSTLEFIDAWMDQLHTVKCLTILTFRPEFEATWPHRDHLSALELSRLSRTETKALVTKLTNAKTLPEEVMSQIISKTDGVPLFVEELTKMVLESGLIEENDSSYRLTGHLPSLAIPESLQDSLMARLDQLSTVKEIAQLASTLGRKFSHTLLQAASQLSQMEFEAAIDKLLDAELIFKSGQPPDVEYEFKHALVQETAYNNLLNSTRIQYHRRFALLMSQDFPEMIEKNPELLAYHYSKAQMPEQAIPHWIQAGEIAMSRSANIEAIAGFEHALKDNANLSDGIAKDEHELSIQIKLAVPQTALYGYASEVVEGTYKRARQLSRKIGHISLLFPSIYGMWRFYLLGAQYSMADELSRELIMLSNQSDDPVFEIAAHRSRGATLFYLGQLTEARSHLEKAIAKPASDEDRSRALSYDVVDAVVASHAYLSWTLWLLGYPDAARAQSDLAVSTARSINHQFSIALANCFGSWTHQFCRDESRTKQIANEALNLSTDHTFRFWIGWARIMDAWADKDHLAPQTRMENSKRGMEEWLGTGSRLGQSYFLQLIASIPAVANSNSQNQYLSDALNFCDESNEGFWRAEILRVKGEQLLHSDPSKAVESARLFNQSTELAVQQGARSLQLRSAMSHYRLTLESGASDQLESKSKLSDIFATFTEGYDTRDLIEAEELLRKNTPPSPSGVDKTLLS